MPKIDFYVLSDDTPDAYLRQACRVAEQAVDQGQRVFVRVTSQDDAKRIDDLLWTFGDRSFLPHEIVTSHSPSHPLIKVLIGDSTTPAGFDELLINLGSGIPGDAATLQRIVEIVPMDAERKRLARERYKHYRDGGMEPATQNV